MSETSQWLADLVEAATVHFTADLPGTPRMWGSGFFVAPGLIVTCAHVMREYLADAQDTVFLVRGNAFNGGRPARATLQASLWDLTDGGRIPVDEDLAVVGLSDPDLAREHGCVWLADWPEQPAGSRRSLFGYVPEREDGGGAAERWSADTEVLVHEGDYGRRFDESGVKIVSGLSGGPVIDPVAGAVVGVIKSRRPDERAGGLCIATTALRKFGALYQDLVRAHDSWHEARGRRGGAAAGQRVGRGAADDWIGRQPALPGFGSGAAHADGPYAGGPYAPGPRAGGPYAGGPHAGTPYDGNVWTPEDRRTALGFLAALPDPERPYAVTLVSRLALPRQRVVEPVTPLTWRDGHGELYDGSTPQHAEYFLRYLDHVQQLSASQGRGSRKLADWIELRRGGPAARTAPLPPVLWTHGADGEGPRRHPGPDDPRPVVVLELHRLEGERHSYDWTLRMGDAEGYPRGSGHLVPAADLIHRVGGPLAKLFRRVDLAEWPAPLEIAVDLGDFDRPVHRWQVNQQANLDERELKELLGVRRPVVLRHLERAGTPDDAWADRWDDTEAAPRLTARRTPARGALLGRGELAGFAAGEIPVLCRSARDEDGHEALSDALAAGHGIALWHVDGHEEQHCRESCDALHQFAAAELDRTEDVAELPDRVRRIREAISTAGRPHPTGRSHPAEGFALLYDDPRRPLPGDAGVLDSPA